MSSSDLILFTDRRDSYSDGASRTNWTQPCYLSHVDYNENGEQSEAIRYHAFPICSAADGIQVFVGICNPDGEVLQLSDAQTSRLFCHFMIQQLPDAAFGEASESLSGMYEYYKDMPAALPAPEAMQTVRGRITGSYVSPVNPITEE